MFFQAVPNISIKGLRIEDNWQTDKSSNVMFGLFKNVFLVLHKSQIKNGFSSKCLVQLFLAIISENISRYPLQTLAPENCLSLVN